MDRKQAIGIANKFNDTIFTNTPEFVEALEFLISDSEAIERIGGVFPAKSSEEVFAHPDYSDMELAQEMVNIARVENKTLDQCLHAQVKICEDCKADVAYWKEKAEALEIEREKWWSKSDKPNEILLDPAYCKTCKAERNKKFVLTRHEED